MIQTKHYNRNEWEWATSDERELCKRGFQTNLIWDKITRQYELIYAKREDEMSV